MQKSYLHPQNLFLLGLLVLAIGVPTSNFLMSVSQMMMGVAWLWQGNFRQRIAGLLRSRAVWVLFSLFLLHMLGLLYTSDFSYALKDLRTKLPILLIPFMMVTMPLPSERQFSLIIWVYTLTVLTAGLIGIYNARLLEAVDYRQYTIGISHIRFGLNVCLAIFLLGFEVITHRNKFLRITGFILLAWFIVYLIFFGAITAITITGISALAVSGILVFRHCPRWAGILFVAISLAGIFYLIVYISDIIGTHNHRKSKIDISQLEKHSADGNAYLHDTIYFGKENGEWVGLYYCPNELPNAWADRSELDYFGDDLKGQPLMATIVRYLNSKGLRKDANGLARLSDEEIRLIENGVANVNYIGNNPLKQAINEFLFGYERYLDGNGPQGSSIMQRIELWKASFNLIRKNPWIGVGTGDIPNAFKRELDEMDSDLEDTSLRSHNQFLSMTIGFGIPGLIWFLIVLIYPPVVLKKLSDLRYLTFFCIFLLSLINEDTIESQAGVTFYAFWNTLLLFYNGSNPEGKNP
jgi:hypothetical protein